MAERRLLQLQSSNDAKSYRQLNRRISKSFRYDLRLFYTNRLKETIQRNQGSKVFAKDKSIGQSQMTKLKREDGSIASPKPEVLGEIERFYGQLYTLVAKSVDEFE